MYERNSGARVLMVDDSAELREAYVSALESEGFQAYAVGSGAEALVEVRQCRPDLVMTDVFMAGMDGLELLTRLRSDFLDPVPVIVVSGFPDAQDEALRRGARLFLQKPLSLEELLGAVQSVLTSEDLQSPPLLKPPGRAVSEATERLAQLGVELLLTPQQRTRVACVLRWLGQWLGEAHAIVLAPRNEEMYVVCTGSEKLYPEGERVGGVLANSARVLETGSNLIVSNVRAQRALPVPKDTVEGFVACIPFKANGLPVGVLCLTAGAPRAFGSKDLALLEYLAERISRALSGIANTTFLTPTGLIERKSFEWLLSSLLDNGGQARGLSLLVAEMESGSHPEGGRVLDFVDTVDTACGDLGKNRLALFCGTPSDHAQTVSRYKGVIDNVLPLRRVVEVNLEGPLPRVHADGLLRWGMELLSRAESERKSVQVRLAHSFTAAGHP